jgi:CreA protein
MPIKFIVSSFFFSFCLLFVGSKETYGETIGSVSTKGILFKDKLQVEAFDDPSIKGVTCYTTVHKRALSFTDSSSASLACRQTGKIKGNLISQKNVFSQTKSLFFKKTVVDRFYDSNRNVLVYLTYTKGVSKKNTSHSLSTVVIRPWN